MYTGHLAIKERRSLGTANIDPPQRARISLPSFRRVDFDPPPTREEWNWILENQRLLTSMSGMNRIRQELIDKGEFYDTVTTLAPFVVRCLRSWREEMGASKSTWVAAYIWNEWQRIGRRAQFFYLRKKGAHPPPQPYLFGEHIFEQEAHDEEPTDSEKIVKLMAAYDRLRNNHREVLRRRFGIGDHDPETLQAISEDWGITKERVRQIEAKALVRLRENFEGELADRPASKLQHIPKKERSLNNLMSKCDAKKTDAISARSEYQPFTFVA